MPNILVIEDNAEVRDNLGDILGLAGYEVLQAPNGKEGIQLARREHPDLILCDIMMPDLDGFGVLKILSEGPDTVGIPFIFVTAKSEQDDLRRGMNLGADDFVTKPFYKDELLRVIEVRLRKQSQRNGPAGGRQEWSGFVSQSGFRRALEELLEQSTTRRYRRGEAIYREGESVRDVFVLRDGYAKHQKTTSFGKTLIVFVFAPGDLFGYPEAVAERAYEHDTVALTDLEVDLIPAKVLRDRLASDPNLAGLLVGHLAHGLLDADRRMMQQAYLSVRERCAKALLRADRVFDGYHPWPMSREELAQWAGTAKETLIRNLTDFRESGLVDGEGNAIEILDRSRLERIAG